MGNINTIVKAAVAVVMVTTGTYIGNKALEQASKDLKKKA